VETLKSHDRQPLIFQESHIEKNGVEQRVRKLSLWKCRDHIVPRFDDGVACGTALGIVILRWLVGSIGRSKTVGITLILESAISPSTAVRKLLVVLQHEIDIVKRAGDQRRGRVGFLLAERIRTTGGSTLRSIGHIARIQRVLDNDADYVDPLDMLVELREDNAALTGRLREVHEVVDGLRDIATASLIENWIDETERRAWFLFESSRRATR
jgi:hypothetical protein